MRLNGNLQILSSSHSPHFGIGSQGGVGMAASEGSKVERLCRYIARPVIVLERLPLNHRGQVLYRLKKPSDDVTTAIVMSPMELMKRLAALVPRPRVHLTRFSGVFAPHYKYRSLVVSKPHKAYPLSNEDELRPIKTRLPWARVLKRVFTIDVESCHLCEANRPAYKCALNVLSPDRD